MWNFDSLYLHISTQLNELREMIQDRYKMHVKEVNAQLLAQRELTEQALSAAEKAVTKTEQSVEKRLDAIGELRATMISQAAMFMPRSEVESAVARNAERIKELADIVSGHVTRLEWNAAHERLVEQVREITDVQNKAVGTGAGRAATWGAVVAIIAALGAIISIYVAINHL